MQPDGIGRELGLGATAGATEPGATHEVDATRGFGAAHPLQILLVDDNRVNLLLATRLLARLGYEVTAVNSGYEAIEAVTASDFDLVLMDIAMPGLDGIETTRRIRDALEPDQCPRIVAFTANVFEDSHESYIAQGLDGLLPKPIHLGELTEILNGTTPISLDCGPVVTDPTSLIELPSLDQTFAAGSRLTTPPAGGERIGGDPFDRDALIAMFGDQYESMLSALVGVYLIDAAQQIEAMRRGLQNTDNGHVARAAHSLKGSSAGIALPNVVSACQLVENAIDQGSEDDLAMLIDRVEACVLEAQMAGG